MNSSRPACAANLFAGAALVLMLVACGGGGGSSSSPTTGSGSSGIPNYTRNPAFRGYRAACRQSADPEPTGGRDGQGAGPERHPADLRAVPLRRRQVRGNANRRRRRPGRRGGHRCASPERAARQPGRVRHGDLFRGHPGSDRRPRQRSAGVADRPPADGDRLGFWGDYGMGVVSAFRGDLSGRYDGVSFSGAMAGATAMAFGEASGTNPTGIGSATWEGVAEAASLRSYTRQQGTASVSIADLSNPRVSVNIRLSGRSIGSAAWNGMALFRGEYGAGIVGRDFLRGKLHGPGHEETYGVFDTGTWVGAFGAKRE